MKEVTKIPEPTRKRLVQLSNILSLYPEDKITSKKISELTGWTESKIRHDLWLAGYSKGISNGYKVSDLNYELNLVLGIEISGTSQKISTDADTNQKVVNESAGMEPKNLCIVGLGRLGAALLDENLTGGNQNFHIKAGFDSNLNRVEILRSIYALYPASEMNYVIKKEKINYAILTVADKDAQNMTERLINAGVKGIINMTNMVLKVPQGIKVENLSIINALKLVV